jgi:hypothetical protein
MPLILLELCPVFCFNKPLKSTIANLFRVNRKAIIYFSSNSSIGNEKHCGRMPTFLLTGKGEFLYSPKSLWIRLSELQISDYANSLSYLKPKKKEVQVYFKVLWTEDCCRWTTIRDFLNSFINYWLHCG